MSNVKQFIAKRGWRLIWGKNVKWKFYKQNKNCYENVDYFETKIKSSKQLSKQFPNIVFHKFVDIFIKLQV